MRVGFIDTVHVVLEDKLKANNFRCEDLTKLTYDELLCVVEGFDGLVIRSRFTLDAFFLDKCKQLKFIARSGAGMENIDLVYAQKRGIICFNSPEGNRDAVGEHCLGMLLMLFNKLNIGDAQIRQGLWKREGNRGVELGGKTVGIIGYGNNGRAFAEKLRGFDTSVLAYDKYISGFGDEYVDEVDIIEIFNRADVISFHIPQNEETLFMFNEEFLSKFKRSIYVINASRGKVLALDALVSGLKNGAVLGACLDVLETESKSFENSFLQSASETMTYLLNSDKVVFTPHVAGWTVESYHKLSDVLAQKILAKFG